MAKIPAALSARIVATGRSIQVAERTLEDRKEKAKEKQASYDAAKDELRAFTDQADPSAKSLSDEDGELLLGITQRLKRTQNEWESADREQRRSKDLYKELQETLAALAIQAAEGYEKSAGTSALDLPAELAEIPVADLIGKKLGAILEELSIVTLGQAMKGMGKSGAIIMASGGDNMDSKDAVAISEALHAAAEALHLDTAGMLVIDEQGAGTKRKKKAAKEKPDPDQMELDCEAALKSPRAEAGRQAPSNAPLPEDDENANPAEPGGVIDRWLDSREPIMDRDEIPGVEFATDLVSILFAHSEMPHYMIRNGLAAIDHWAQRAITEGHSLPGSMESLMSALKSVEGPEEWTIEQAIAALALTQAVFPGGRLCDDASLPEEQRIPAWLVYELLAACCAIIGFELDDETDTASMLDNEIAVFAIQKTIKTRGGLEKFCTAGAEHVLGYYPELRDLDHEWIWAGPGDPSGTGAKRSKKTTKKTGKKVAKKTGKKVAKKVAR